MQLEITFDNEPRLLAGITECARATLAEMGLPTEFLAPSLDLVSAALKDAVELAYPTGESGRVRLSIQESAGKLEIQVRDFGLPQDIAALDEQWHTRAQPSSPCTPGTSYFDEVHWLAFGREGKALQLVKWLHMTRVDAAVPDAHAPTAPPLAPPQSYTIRRMQPADALEISQLMYRTYGSTYFNEDVYYPERIKSLNERGELVSVVAVTEDNCVAGHCALERDQTGPTAELGQAAVDPAHRGRGLLDQMKEALEAEARALALAGWYADAVTVHTFTQQSNAHHGGHVCAIDLAVAPASEDFKDIASAQPQRVSCVTYFHWLTTPQPRRVCVPPRHQKIVAAIYGELGVRAECLPATGPAIEQGTLTVKLTSGAAQGTIRVDAMGRDTVPTVRHALRELVERSGAEVVVVELPIDDPATSAACEELESLGFGFIGVGPHFAPRGDVLRLAYLVSPVERNPIKTFEPFAGALVDYALAEQGRVREKL